MQIFVELRGALAARPDGFLLQITTQSKEPPAGVFKAELSTARAVRDGRLDLPLLPLLYELPDDLANDGGWKQRKYWPLINPNLGRSVDVAFLDRALIKAEDEGAEALALLASQHFNVEVGVGLKSDRWAGADFWEQAAEPGLTLEAILARCDVVCIGVDGGGLDDLLAIAVLGRETATRRWLLWVKAWAHVSVLERRKSEAPRLRDLEREGDLVITGEMEEAFAAVADIAAQVDAAGLLAKVGLDPMGVGAIVDALAERGIEGDDRVVGISQGWTLNGAIKTTEVKLASGALVHCGQPLLAWAVGNARVEPRGNAITITKQTAGSAKIDPLMATFDAVALMSRNPDAVGGSYLDTEDLILV
jgi:phage terminase large subunit-like protein